jgi:hypothetical protein
MAEANRIQVIPLETPKALSTSKCVSGQQNGQGSRMRSFAGRQIPVKV